ncbi:MAG: hypothetical protein J6B11_03540 [Spirochaetales bacterium]|nr:hypothetical protein [Spirochaetales bacterium]
MKIFTKFICLSIVAVSLLTGCDIENRCSCIEIENNVKYFENYHYNLEENTKEIVDSLEELRDLFHNEDSQDVKKYINKFDDEFFIDNSLVIITLGAPHPGHKATVTSFEPKNNKLRITVELRSNVPPFSSVETVIEFHLIIIETTKKEIKDCTDVEVTIAEPSC